MAIKKTITDNKGQVTTYHRIIAFAPVYTGESPTINVNLASYSSDEYRRKENASESMQISNVGLTLPLPSDDVFSRESIYKAIMALPEFEGSEEV